MEDRLPDSFSEKNYAAKLANSLYRLLDTLPEQEPLKQKAKEKALAILENMTLVFSAKGWASLQKDRAAAALLDDIEVLAGLLALARDRGWIDHINVLILEKEYRAVLARIQVPAGLVRQAMEISYRQPLRISPAHQNEGQSRTISVGQKGYSVRQQKILEILGQREKAQVSDFIKEIPNITKRTMRRDLDDLLKRGVVERAGEWNQVFYVLPKGL
jgi:hypothetical protein